MREHELRRQVVGEMHLRRWPVLAIPGHVIQWVLVVDPDEREAEAWLIDEKHPVPEDQARPAHRSGEAAPGVHFAWERHSEGSSLALFAEAGNPAMADARAWAERLPGRIMRATQIRVVANDAEAKALLPEMDFKREETISCLFSGNARLWADFRLQDDGFGHVVVAANGTDPRDFSRSVQRLQELGNYRNKALMGLPTAQEAWPRLDKAEARLSDLANRVADNAERDDALMEEISGMSLELSAIATGIGYRMSATAAYAQLVRERLDQLEITPIDGYASLVNFTERRFLPAVRTCAAVTERERQLSERAGRLTSLLRARIETRIENQNARLMRSMERSASLQLRLQQLVEGLSIVAASYYLLGLIGYVLKGLGHEWPGLEYDIVLAVLAPVVVLGIWLLLHILKRQLLDKED